MSMVVDRRELDFVLFELLEVEKLVQNSRFAAYDRATVGQMLDAAQQVAEDRFLPIAAELDAVEPVFRDGKVVMPASAETALQAYAEAGFFALPFAEEIGGLGAPWFLNTAVVGMFSTANAALTNYSFLTIAAANLLDTFGSEALKSVYLPPMLAGKWFGTMCLSETQAGSSLGDIRTTATLRPDGLYALKGSKMWISGGEHELSENIVHMVIAKIPGGPPGTKGISLFLVPKRRVGADGAAGASNNIALAGLNHKMGQRACTNCLLNFGETGESIGYLVGEPHRGIEYMFHMMNEARIAVGHAAVMTGLAGYLYSADYARTRTQGRAVDQKDPTSPQVPIIQHADVRRMLLAQKAAVEGAQALCLYCATLVNEELPVGGGAVTAEERAALLGLLTPVVKSWPSEHCLEANKWAIQILGGYGYTRDYPVERLYRDNRLNHIHEGTFGIQGLDLLGRKVLRDEGATLFRLVDEMRRTSNEAASVGDLAEEAGVLSASLDALVEATRALMKGNDPARRLANSTVYLDAFGHIVIGWLWLRQAIVATRALAGGAAAADRAFYAGKLVTCRYFGRHELPLAQARLALCGSLDDTSLAAPVEMFGG